MEYQKGADAYLKQIEEAELRDHRKIGKDLKLFHFQDDAPRHGILASRWLENILNLKDTQKDAIRLQLSRN